MSGPTRDEHFYFEDLVVFQVENSLFRVPRLPFESHSAVFGSMFSLPQPNSQDAEGASDEQPIRLPDTTASEFTQLLRVMFPRFPSPLEPLTIEEWISALKLSTRWEFLGVRQKAIEELQRLPMNPVQKLSTAFKYGVDEWRMPALNDLAQRPEFLTVEEAEALGTECVLKLANVRMSTYRNYPQATIWTSHDFTAYIQYYFNLDEKD